MLYSALITTIATDSQAAPESRYEDNIKQKFLDAVVKLSTTASLDNISELVKTQSGEEILVGKISLEDNFTKLISIKSSTGQTIYTFKEVSAKVWDSLGADAELDPLENHCFYFVDGRDIRFYLSTTVNMNDKQVDIKYIAYPEQWLTTDDIDMYTRYSSLFVEACKNEAINGMKILLRGEQNDMV